MTWPVVLESVCDAGKNNPDQTYRKVPNIVAVCHIAVGTGVSELTLPEDKLYASRRLHFVTAL